MQRHAHLFIYARAVVYSSSTESRRNFSHETPSRYLVQPTTTRQHKNGIHSYEAIRSQSYYTGSSVGFGAVAAGTISNTVAWILAKEPSAPEAIYTARYTQQA